LPGAGPDTEDVAFGASYALGETSEAALEDYARYARAVAQAAGAEALHAADEAPPGPVVGVRVRGAGLALTDDRRRDIEDFARDLAQGGTGSGLGWS
jgi:hypothetical protein